MKYFMSYIIALIKKNSDSIIYKLYPNFINRIKKDVIIIGVTGKNGKSITCDMLVSILKDNGYRVLYNKKGYGVGSTFVRSFKKYDIVVIRIDKNNIFDIHYDYLLCTNLYDDMNIKYSNIILNGCDKGILKIFGDKIAFGIDGDLLYSNIKYKAIINEKDMNILYKYDNKICSYQLLFKDKFNIYNELGVITLLSNIKLNHNQINKSLKKINIKEKHI